MHFVENFEIYYQGYHCKISIFSMRGFFTATVHDVSGRQICEERLQGEFDDVMKIEAIAQAAFRAGIELQNER